ncbi:hypothetical protein PF001_g7008 [Phytophthora fragariae]|uniref:Uncharacterized protein n=1 Tax=Phytophthora fragariae TaxID=53985 RepID=A0A6A4E6H6_9STRA|nr:hypothetical protein PF001_g7008 [Phytophthora fragariae]
MSPSDREDQSTAAQVPPAGPPARERSSGEREESTSQDPTAALLDAIRQLTTRIDAIEKAVTPQRGRQGAVSPELPQRRESIFRQAIDHGSMASMEERHSLSTKRTVRLQFKLLNVMLLPRFRQLKHPIGL